MIMKNKLKILIIEDNSFDQECYQRYLKKGFKKDVTIDIVSNGEEARESLENEVPDCVLLDYGLPDKNGIEVLKDLRASNAFEHLPIIMLTGLGNEQVAVEAMKYGVYDYIVKDKINGKDLCIVICNAIERSFSHKKIADVQSEIRLFASVAAHDLSSPLKNIKYLSEKIEAMVKDEVEEKIRRYFSQLRLSIQGMEILLEGLRVYTKVGRTSVKKGEVDMNEVMETVLINLTVQIEEKKAQIKYEGLPIVWGDKVALIQLFQNLVNNAMKYCKKAPEIKVQASRPNEDSEKEDWIFMVEDNGIGIEEKHFKTIFEVFKRLHGDKEYLGCGLGLATCKKIVENHHGEIWLTSKPGEGSKFFIRLPAKATEEKLSLLEDLLAT